MKLYNTLTRNIDELRPIAPPKVTVYTCGPTVYDYAHIGHWFTYVRWDTLIRTLKASGLQPEWVVNITDVGHLVSDADEGEDKLEKGARREGKSAWDIADFYARDFIDDMEQLNMLRPDIMPKATCHILDQIKLVQTLEAKGYTYVISDGVYYDTSKFPTYADFAKLDLDEQQAGARVEFNPEKRNPTDFALWKFSPEGQMRDMEWWAPWQRPGSASDEQRAVGLARRSPHDPEHEAAAPAMDAPSVPGSWGFPGWHVECSAMSMKYLGETLDIHAGGIDHLPVHHTNEIAQSEAATGKPFANIWLHSNHVLIDGQKISKSLGNGIRLEDVTAKGYDPMVLRLHILESHYRSQSRFSWDSLEAARNRLKSYERMADLQFQTAEANLWFAADQRLRGILEAMQNDLNSPAALALLSSLAADAEERLVSSAEVEQFKSALRLLDDLFGLKLSDRQDITPEQKQLILKRREARQAKEWEASDKLRDELLQQGIGLRDTPYGAVWFRI